MSLFERIQYRLNEEPNKSDSKDQSKKSSRNKKKFSDNISNKVKTTNKPAEVQGREDATNPKKGGYPRVEDSLDNKPSGKTKLSNTTQGGPVKTFFDKDTAKVKREKLLQGRQDYIDPKTNKASKEGIKKYISKARNMASGTNANNKANQKAAEVISKSAGKEYASKINKKYGGTLAKTRKVSDSTFKKIQKKINIKSPVRTSPVSGGLIPLKGKELRDYKRQLQQQQQPQSGSTTTTKPKVIKKTKIKGDPLKVNTQQPKDLAKELEKLKKNLKNPVDKSFGDALKKNQTAIKTPPVKELEKIKPKVTTSKSIGKLSQTKLGNPSSLAKTSRHLLKHKNKYAVAAGLALAGGAYLLGKTRVATAKTKENKALLLAKQKKAKEPKKMVDVSLFLNKTGTPPTKTSKPKLNSVYDKNYIKNLKPKTTTPKNNPISKYTSGVSNAAKSNATLPYNSNKIASYAKPSQRSSKK